MVELGRVVEGWTPPMRPGALVLEGAAARLEPLTVAHAAALHRANSESDAIWDYLPYGPFDSAEGYAAWVGYMSQQDDPHFFAVVDRSTGLAGGVASLMRITPDAGSIEVGHICLSPSMQRTRAATEMIYLFAEWVFAIGYRRFEWKCDALNLPSRRAAQRFGFSFEGIFRQAAVVKGRNRDTAWFAMINSDWPALKEAYRTWLSEANFDEEGRQRLRLGDLTALYRVASDPGLATG